ncbi:esterase/lipase family protein [Micromonospora sp. NPDC051925]|uniref:esterase/lipase family protein n=1 Tax=Micromonospora sp. NPDC051925 TaxID=3364288 RepID=UPI0037CC13DC
MTSLSPMIEAAVLVFLGFVAAKGIAPQVTAVWPYDTYHDLRWLYVYHRSWWEYLLWLSYVLVTRGLFTTLLVVLAWPEGLRRPSVWWLLRRNVGLAVLVGGFVAPWAAISVAASVVALSWVLLASLLPMFLLAPFLQRAAVVGHWWRGLPSLSLVGWSLLNFVVLTVAGALCWSVPGWWTVPVAGVAGVCNGLLWNRTVRAALLSSRVRWARVPVTPLAALLAVAVPLVIPPVTDLVPGNEQWIKTAVLDRPLPSEVTRAVIVLTGYGSEYGGEQPADPRVQRFSYRGLDPDGKPLAYQAQDTRISVADSVRLLEQQVDRLHRRTGRKVALVGESEGAMVARTYLARRRDQAVDTLVMFSPLIYAGRAYYPPPHQDQGWGVVTGWQLRVIFALADIGGGAGGGPDEPFIRSLLDDAPFYRNQLMCPVPGVRIVAFLPTTTAAEAPPGEYARIPVFQIPGVHGGLLDQRQVQDRLVDFLLGKPIGQHRGEYPWLQRLGAAWQAPPLPIAANPAWADNPQPDPAFTGKVCLPAR